MRKTADLSRVAKEDLTKDGTADQKRVRASHAESWEQSTSGSGNHERKCLGHSRNSGV